MEPLIFKKKWQACMKTRMDTTSSQPQIFCCMGTAWFHYIEASKTLFFLLLTVDYKNGSYRVVP